MIAVHHEGKNIVIFIRTITVEEDTLKSHINAMI